MNLDKQQKKMTKYLSKAEECTSRKEAQQIINKYEKARVKVFASRLIEHS